MTKYLTTIKELKVNIGKKIIFTNNHFEYHRYGICILEKINTVGLNVYSLEVHCINYGRSYNILIDITPKTLEDLEIELIEEDNKEENKKHFPDDEDWILEEQNNKPMGLADNINHPSHYQGKIECIDYLQDKLTAEEFKGFLKGNVLKYLSRAGKKDDELQDIKKAKWYLEKLINNMEK